MKNAQNVKILSLLVLTLVIICVSGTLKAKAEEEDNPFGKSTEARAQELLTLAQNYGLVDSNLTLEEFKPKREASYSFVAKILYRAEKLRNSGCATMKAPSTAKAMAWLLDAYVKDAMANPEDAYLILLNYHDGKDGNECIFESSGKASWQWLVNSVYLLRGYGDSEEAWSNSIMEVRMNWESCRAKGERLTRIEALEWIVNNFRPDIYDQEMQKVVDSVTYIGEPAPPIEDWDTIIGPPLPPPDYEEYIGEPCPAIE